MIINGHEAFKSAVLLQQVNRRDSNQKQCMKEYLSHVEYKGLR